MEKNTAKPFYFQPPWNILFDLEVLEKVSPWDINLSFLLLSFLEEMENRAEIDFRASGVALDSSATIYLMKAQLLLKLEEPPLSPEPKSDFIPPPLILPLRYELTTTTIQNLLEALNNALKTERLFALKAPLRNVLPPAPQFVPPISLYLMEMEERMERLIQKILSLAEKGEVIAFSRIVHGLKKLQQIRNFIILLFLAHKGRVNLWQEENSNQIFITINGG
jgi:chromatin segregation and condensation protein Rec8/ScpA/Scc1 (kleisin family)